MAHWIPVKKNTYRCSSCGTTLITSYPPAQWTVCPFCKAEMTEEATDGNSDTAKDS